MDDDGGGVEELWEEEGGTVNVVMMNWGGDVLGDEFVMLEDGDGVDLGVGVVKWEDGVGVDLGVGVEVDLGVGVVILRVGVTIPVGCGEILLEFEITGFEIDDCSSEYVLVGFGISEVGIKVVGWTAEGRGVVTFWFIIPWELSTVIGPIIK